MKILLSGASGFIGSHVESALSSTTCLVAIDREQPDPPTKNFKKIDVYFDYTKLINLFETEKFDAVIHLAADAGVPRSISVPNIYYRNNVIGFSNILDACRIGRVKKLIYASSSSVYQNKSPYASSKFCTEVMAESFQKVWGIPTIGLRLFNVYGPGQNDRAAFSIWMEQIKANLPITIHGDGKQRRHFTYIDDVVISIIKYLHLQRNDVPIVEAIAHTHQTSIIEAAELICTMKGARKDFSYLPHRVGDVLSNPCPMDEKRFECPTTIQGGLEKWLKSGL